MAFSMPDFGWANAGWHRPIGYKEVQTPSMNALVKEGIELDHAYSFKFCSPTRSSLQVWTAAYLQGIYPLTTPLPLDSRGACLCT